MSIDLSSILSPTSGGSSIDKLVAQYMAVERKPVDDLKTKRDQLDVRMAMFNDLRSKINDLKSAADALSSGTLSSFNSHTVTSSDSSYATATAFGSAANGVYALDKIVLANAHRLQSSQLSSTWAANGAGTFILNGTTINVASGATLEDVRTAINGAKYSAGKGVVATIVHVDSTHSRLVLDAKSTGSANVIKMADVTGSTLSSLGLAVSAPIPGVTASSSSSDPSYPASLLTDGATGSAGGWRGDSSASTWTVTLDLGASKSIDRLEWGVDQGGTSTAGTPKDYQLEYSNDGGVTWSTLKTVTGGMLAAGGRQEDSFATVTANRVRMTVTSTADGTPPAIDEMKLFDDGGSLAPGAELQGASDASLTVNGIPVTGQSGNRIGTAVSGLTLQLNKEGGPVTLTVVPDTASMNAKISTFLDKLNSLADYLRTKSAVTKGSDGNYTRGLLNGRSLYTGLRESLSNDMVGTVSGLTSGAPTRLTDIGIGMDSNLHFVVTDQTKLDNWLSSDAASVASLFNSSSGIANSVVNRLKPYVTTSDSGTQAYLDREQASIDSQKASIDARTRSLNERLALKEKAYTDQFTRLQAAMIKAYQLNQQITTIFSQTTG